MTLSIKGMNRFCLSGLCAVSLLAAQGCTDTDVDTGPEVDASKGIHFFHGTYPEALEEAKKQDKLIFIDFYTEWCGPCKSMVKYVFSQQPVGDVFNKHFVSVKVDAEDEDINGLQLAERFSIRAFPTYVVMDANDRMVTTNSGYINRDEFLAWADIAISGMNLEKFSKLEDAIRAGARDERTVLTFLRYAKHINGDRVYQYTQTDPSERPDVNEYYRGFDKLVDDVAVEYLDNASTEQLLTPAAYELILDYKTNAEPGDKVVGFVLANHADFLKMGHAEELAEFVTNHSLQLIAELAAKGDVAYRDKVKAVQTQYADLLAQLPEYRAVDFKLPGYRLDILENIYGQGRLDGDLMLLDLQYQAATSAWGDYLDTAKELYRKYPAHRAFAEKYFDIFSRFAHGCQDQVVLSKANAVMESVFVDHMKEYSRPGIARDFHNLDVLSAYPAWLVKVDRRSKSEDVLENYIDMLEDKHGAEDAVSRLKTYRAQM